MKRKYKKLKENLFLKMICICLFISFVFSGSLTYGQMADGKDKWVGNIWYNESEPLNFSTYWNQVTPENAGKWGSVEGTRDQMNWSQLDTMYSYAKSKGYPFKEHCFVWGAQEPSWVASLSQDEQRAEVEEWIRLYGERYPDTDFIDVVNEMFHVTPSYKNAIGGDGETGWDWVIWSFEKARQYCPNAKLLINEYNVIEGWTPVQDYVNLINILKDRGLIDGIGVQNHGLENTNLDDVRSRLTQLGNTGLPVYVSELDLDFGTDENAQANRYAELFPVLYEHPAVAGITLWGYVEGHHWRENAYILRSNGSERPALTWIKNYLASSTPTSTPTPDSYVRLCNAATGMYIDGMGSTSNGATACQWDDSNSNNQQWKIIESGNYIMIQNRATGLYLDGMGRTSNGSICSQWSNSGSENQQWTQEATGSNVRFKNRATGLYLDGMGSTSNGSDLCQWDNSGSTNQQWQIK